MVSIRPAGPEDGGAVARVHEVARAAYYGAAAPADVDPARAAMWRAVIGDPARATVLCAEDGAGLAFPERLGRAAGTVGVLDV